MLMGFCLFPKQKLLDWLCCGSPVWLAGLHHQLPIFIFSAIFVLSSLALSRCYLAKAATLRSFICFSTACLLVFWLLLGVVLSLQEMLDNWWPVFADQDGLLLLSPAVLGFLLPIPAA